MSVARVDHGNLGRVERTPQGGIRAPAFLTRTGIFDYRLPNGTTRREYRPAEEVFKADSLATLEDAPVTDFHPGGMVNGTSFKSVNVGHVKGTPKQDGDKVAATIVVQDAETVKAIENRERTQLSCGYRCDLEFTSGEFENQRYDAIQRNVVYNHVAIVPKGRAGAEVALRLDAEDNVVEYEDTAMTKIIHIDGKDYEYGTAAHLDKIQTDANAKTAAVQTKLDAAIAETAKEKARADKAEGERDALKKEADPKRMDEKVAARSKLLAVASKVIGSEYKSDGVSDRDVKIAVLTHLDADAKFDGKSDDYIQGQFEAVEKRADSGTGHEDARTALLFAEHDDMLMDGSGKGAPQNGGGGQGIGVQTPAWRVPLSSSKRKSAGY